MTHPVFNKHNPHEPKPKDRKDDLYDLITHLVKETGIDISTLVLSTYPNLLDNYVILRKDHSEYALENSDLEFERETDFYEGNRG